MAEGKRTESGFPTSFLLSPSSFCDEIQTLQITNISTTKLIVGEDGTEERLSQNFWLLQVLLLQLFLETCSPTAGSWPKGSSFSVTISRGERLSHQVRQT